MPSNHLILCRPLLLLLSIFPSVRIFSNELALLIRWPKYWSLSFNISPSNEHPGLISFRMDWLDLLAVQGTLKSLLKHNSSKASVLLHSAFFIVQPSHPYMTTGKSILSNIRHKKWKENMEKIYVFICRYSDSCIGNEEAAMWLLYGGLMSLVWWLHSSPASMLMNESLSNVDGIW